MYHVEGQYHCASVGAIYYIARSASVKPICNWVTNSYADVVFVSLGDNPNLPESVDTVIEVEMKNR